MFWYIGVPAVLLGTLGAALLARRCLRGQAPAWALPLMVFAWVIVTTLYRPAIVPDQPWASRRLVPAVLPGFILLAVWACAWLVGWPRAAGPGPGLAAGPRRRGRPGRRPGRGHGRARRDHHVRPAARARRPGREEPVVATKAGLAFKRTYGGEIPAVDRMCAAIPTTPRWSSWAPGSPTASPRSSAGCAASRSAILPGSEPAAVHAVSAGIRSAGRRPGAAGGQKAQVSPYGPARQIMKLRSMEDCTL